MVKLSSIRANILCMSLHCTSLTANVRGVINTRADQLSRRWQLAIAICAIIVEAAEMKQLLRGEGRSANEKCGKQVYRHTIQSTYLWNHLTGCRIVTIYFILGKYLAKLATPSSVAIALGHLRPLIIFAGASSSLSDEDFR